MSNITGNIDISLDDQIFKHALYFGIVVIASLFIYDILFSGDYLSVMIEVAAGIVFAINFFMVSGQRAPEIHRNIFSAVQEQAENNIEIQGKV